MDKAKEVLERAVNSLKVEKGKDRIYYMDKIESVADCYGAPYSMCRFADGTVLMVPKELASAEDIAETCFPNKEKTDRLPGIGVAR